MEHDSQPEAYYIHVWIRGIHPVVWRRFLVRSDSTLADLHAVLQMVLVQFPHKWMFVLVK